MDSVPLVKICGITRVQDAELATELGAWAIGLIFHGPSPRSVSPADAEAVAAAVRKRALVTGVFVNHTLDDIARLHARIGFDVLQLHGDEGPAFAAEAHRRTGALVMKAVQAADRGDVQALDRFRDVAFHLVDARVPGLRGGTGQTVDHELLRGRRAPVPLVLSGGLTPDNVAAAIEAVQPYAVDTASGTEAEPGVKDPERLRAFFEAVESVRTASVPE